MQKHAIALGYFFLAVLCIHVSHQQLLLSLSPLLFPAFITAATAASLVGCTFFIAASMPHLRSAKNLLVRLFQDAQKAPASDQNPVHTANSEF